MSKAPYSSPRQSADDFDDEEYLDDEYDESYQEPATATNSPSLTASAASVAQQAALPTRRTRGKITVSRNDSSQDGPEDEYDYGYDAPASSGGLLGSPGRAVALGLAGVLLVGVFAAVIWLATSRGGTTPTASVPQTGGNAGTVTGNVPVIMGFNLNTQSESQAPTKGAFAPDFVWDDSGKPVALSSYRGDKPLFINFWGTWCPPCRAEMPEMQNFWQKHSNEIEVLGVSMGPRDDPVAVLSFVTNAKYTWKFVHDGDYKVAEKYQVMNIPSSYFIDKNGLVKVVHVGAMSGAQMEQYLQQVK